MSLSIPAAWQAYIQKAHQDTPWLWCWLITLDATVSATTKVAIVNNPEPVTVDSVVYNPFPVIHSEIEENSDGDLPQMQLQIDNTSKLLAPYVDQGGGFLNRNCQLTLVNTADLTKTYTFTFTITACTLTTKSATMRLEVDSWFERRIPMDVYSVERCRHIYGSTRCGYVINAAAGYETCGKTIADCILRGADMASRNLVARQPASFGGFLGIPQS